MLLSKSNYIFALSGTGIQIDALEESLTSPIMKAFTNKFYITPGSFTSYDLFNRYVTSYTNELDDEMLVLHSILLGRYRFTAMFLAKYLECQDAVKALKEFRDSLIQTLKAPLVKYLKLNLQDENESIYKLIVEFVKNNDAIQELVYEFLNSYWTYSYTKITSKFLKHAKIIQYGFALIAPDNRQPAAFYTTIETLFAKVELSEPLIFELIYRAYFR